MSLVFVHGVATRRTPEYIALREKRDALFRSLVLKPDEPVFDPDWGSQAVQLTNPPPWLPSPDGATAFAMGAAGSPLPIAPLAKDNPELAIDLALSAYLTQKTAQLSAEDLQLFETTVRFLEDTPPDRSLFDAVNSNQDFVETLRAELPKPQEAAEAMDFSVFGAIKTALGNALDWAADAGSDAILRKVRKSLSIGTAMFLGDIFVYLRWRELDGAKGTYNRIFQPIIDALVEAITTSNSADRLIIVGHSLGGVILYDLLTDTNARAAIESRTQKPLRVDALITVGSQPGLFADMKLYTGQTSGKQPPPAGVQRWINVYDYTDIFSFLCAPAFEGVEDLAFNNVTSVLNAHSAYFLRPSFYVRLRARLGKSR